MDKEAEFNRKVRNGELYPAGGLEKFVKYLNELKEKKDGN